VVTADPAMRATISVASRVIWRWPSRSSDPGGVTICTRTARADGSAAVETTGSRCTNAAVFSVKNGGMTAPVWPSARSTAWVSSVPSSSSASAGNRVAGIAAAIDLAGSRALTAVDEWAGRTPEQVTSAFLELWRGVLVHSELRAGCAVLAVTVATDSPDLLGAAADVFRAWRTKLAALFEAGGLPNAPSFAATLVAASEGAVVLSRAEQSMEPFELVAAEMLERASAATPGGTAR